MTHKQMKARRRRMESGVEIVIHSVPAQFESTPGVPDDPENPKASEGMEAFRAKVYEAINARGWNVYMNAMAEHDFIIMELYDSSAICQDTLDGKYYRLPISVSDDGSVSLGDPEEYDITYTPSGSPEPESSDAEPEPSNDPLATQTKRVFRYKGGKVLVLASKSAASKRPTYRVLLVQSGFTQDGRYITRAALEDAVARNLFDGVKCYYQHPDPDDPHAMRPGLPCGFVKPGSVTLEENKIGEVDVWADVPLLQTDVGNSIRDVLDASLEIGVPLLGNSVYSKEVWQYTGKAHDRTCLIVSKFETMDAVDFVTEAAFPRASVKARLAASAKATTTNSPKGSLTMEDKQRLDKLDVMVTNLAASVEKITQSFEAEKRRADGLELEKAVDAELAASGLSTEDQALLKPLLMKFTDNAERKVQLEVQKRAFLAAARTASPSGPVGADNGNRSGNEKKKPTPLRADVQASVDAAMRAAGVKPEIAEKAQLEVVGAE